VRARTPPTMVQVVSRSPSAPTVCHRACSKPRDRQAVERQPRSAKCVHPVPARARFLRGPVPVQSTKAATTCDPILVDLALQGGGSHGAFTWGMLDRGALAWNRWYFRYVGWRDECRGAGRRPRESWSRWRTGGLAEFLAPRLRGCSLQPSPPRAARCISRPLVAGLFAHLRRHRSHVSPSVAL
jgi:hypothetical protein